MVPMGHHTTARKSILKSVKLQSLVAKCCKMRKTVGDVCPRTVVPNNSQIIIKIYLTEIKLQRSRRL